MVILVEAMDDPMRTRRTFMISLKSPACRAGILGLTIVAMAWTVSGQRVKRSSGSDASRVRRAAPVGAALLAARQRFLENVRSGVFSRTNRPTHDRAA
jgi:hypothetical protein